VGAEHAFELARHLTERDRELALCLYQQQVADDRPAPAAVLLVEASCAGSAAPPLRAACGRSLYPPSQFGAGKPQAHWLLDEAGAVIVAATLGLDRRDAVRGNRHTVGGSRCDRCVTVL
jgi:hypothetical protein